MRKVVFWSPLHGQSGMTSNITLISLMAGMLYKKRCILTQTHFNYNNLEAPLVGANTKNNASSDYYIDVGLDALIRNFKGIRLSKDIVENCCINLSNTNVSLLPGTTKANRECYEFETGLIGPKLFDEVNEFYDLVFVDSSPSKNELSEKLMEAATILGACGTAYAMRFIRASIQGGIEIGFDVHTASLIVEQTVKGAAELLLQKDTHPEQEIDKVTTPKGCTIAGLNEMEHQGFSSSLIKGISVSFKKIAKN